MTDRLTKAARELPSKLLDVACRLRVGESLFRDDEIADQSAHELKSALDDLDALFAALDLDAERFRTEGGSINQSKLRAALLHPDEYLPPTHWLNAQTALAQAEQQMAQAAESERASFEKWYGAPVHESTAVDLWAGWKARADIANSAPLTEDGREPKAGETWYIKLKGASALTTVTFDDVTTATVRVAPSAWGIEGARYHRADISLIERAAMAASATPTKEA